MNAFDQHMAIEPGVLQTLSSAQAWHYKVVPVEHSAQHLTLLVEEGLFSTQQKEELEFIKGKTVKTEPVPSQVLTDLLLKYYRGTAPGNGSEKKNVSVSVDKAESFV